MSVHHDHFPEPLPAPSPIPAPSGEPWTGSRVLRTALLSEGRGLKLGLATLGFIAHQAAEAMVPVMIGVIIDRAITGRSLPDLGWGLAGLALTFLVLTFAWRWAVRLMVDVFGYGGHRLRRSAVARVLDPRGVRMNRGAGDILTVTASDTDRIAGVAWSVVEQASTLTAIAVSTVALLLISVPLGLGVVGVTVLILIVMHLLSRPIERRGYEEQVAAARAGSMAADLMAGLRVLTGMGAQEEALRRYRERSAQSAGAAVRAARSLALYSGISTAISGVFLALAALAAAWLAASGRMSVGQLVAVIGLAQYLQASLAHVGSFASNWAHKRASVRRLLELLNAEPAVEDGAAPGDPAVPVDPAGFVDPADPVAPVGPASPAGPSSPRPSPSPAIGESVSIGWGRGREAVTLEIAPGELLGIVPGEFCTAGEVSALLGYRVHPSAGDLRVSGVPAVRLGSARTRERVFAPPRDSLIFSGSLRENLVGRELGGGHRAGAGARDLEVDPVAVSTARLGDVLGSLGGDLDASVGEAGSRLSGGQRQRVLLARALHRGEPVIALEEPTSALDAVTEAHIAEGLRAHPARLIVITRSPALLARCHRVVPGPAFALLDGRTGGEPDRGGEPDGRAAHDTESVNPE